ncbi:hypothetical protein LAJ19_20345 (plasmid) [Deinococcus taeanensis]|uniref:hypothetical protein n=1 Tax=Deinococcus taeanensis TaxID=2737050 RepID=UPI001CDD6513|nr:hypothetical protein [Deinococcus taeanensis]UBV45477.1 hypothetical protein LAJ19_20345 [Deinococcus taeanensis]
MTRWLHQSPPEIQPDRVIVKDMGCDLHEHFEVRTDEGWKRIQVLPDLNWDTATPEEEEAYWSLPLCIGRDYDLFAILAGVRNRLNVRPIVACRGIPEDASVEVREAWTQAKHAPEVHSPSWLSLEELSSFEWDQPLVHLDSAVAQDARWARREIVTYRDAVSDTNFVAQGLAKLQTLVDDPRKLRMVFWFDS